MKRLLGAFTLCNLSVCATTLYLSNWSALQAFLILGGIVLTTAVAAIYYLMHRHQVLESQVHQDALTLLPNRIIFNRSLEEQITHTNQGQHRLVATLMMDLDGFKKVNDTLGHPVGDDLLVQVAERLKSVCRGEDVVCRLGGDEFGVVMALQARSEINVVCERILRIFNEPFQVQGTVADVGISIGAAIYPEHGSRSVDLIRYADIAMYEAKTTRVGYTIYDHNTDTNTVEALGMVTALRQGLDSDQFVLNYQLKKDLHTGHYVGAEALIRWNHPTLGLLGPDKFIPLAESTGLIRLITEWVIKRASRDYCALKEEGIDLHTVSINVSPYCVSSGDIMVCVTSNLVDTLITAKNLIFEVTETSISHTPQQLIKVLVCLDMLGVNLSIDDFGTGQASLVYLKLLPVKEIKIDKTFVMGMEASKQDLNIVRSTIDLAHSVGCTVVAEGVETQQIEQLLAHLGCDVVQGYYIARPLSFEDLRTRLLEEKHEC